MEAQLHNCLDSYDYLNSCVSGFFLGIFNCNLKRSCMHNTDIEILVVCEQIILFVVSCGL